MKKVIQKIVLVASLGVVFNACNDLDKNPYSSLSGETSFQTIQDAKYWVNGRYSSLRGRVYGNYMLCTDIQSDLLNASSNFGNVKGELHRWTDLTSTTSEVSKIYEGYFGALSDVNFALEGFEKISVASPEEQKLLNQYKAELHLFRAYYYSQLVLRFAKAYDPVTAHTEKTIPLVLKFDTKFLPERASVQQIYDQIFTDLGVAEQGLTGVVGKVGALRFTKDAVKFLKARTSLYAQNWQQAYTEASSLIDEGKYPLATTQQAFKDIWHNDAATETIFQLFVENPDEKPNVNSGYLGLNTTTSKFSPTFIPTQTLVDKYDDSDFRKAVYFDRKVVNQGTQDYELLLVNKYPGNPALFTTKHTNYAHLPKVFRVAEAYLIAAEAAYKLNDDANAKKYLNALRTARGLGEVTSMGEDLYREIKDERLRELAFEGMRLDDLKRWKQDVVRGTPQNIETIFVTPAEQYHQLNRSHSDEKIVWQLSEREKELNPNLKK